MSIIKRTILILAMMNTVMACVDRYYIEDHIEPNSKLVVDASITDEQESQVVYVSRSSSVNRPEYLPVSDCMVQVSDSLGNTFMFEETSSGTYEGNINKQYLTPGAKFRLLLKTPDNNSYISSYETLLATPPVGKAYYELTTVATSDPAYNIEGVQFYLDFKAQQEYGSKFLFSLEETYEYHSTWPKRSYITDAGIVPSPVDYSTFVCYESLNLPEIYTLSTSNLTESTYIKYPLNFVSDQTQRLLHNYSLLIKQRAISELAYNYWESLKNNNQDDAGLFAQQPSTIRGNITNTVDPDEHVLGLFSVSSISSYRILLGPVTELSFKEVPYCEPIWPEMGYPSEPRPLYLVMMRDPKDPESLVWGYADTKCFDCTLLGGELEKPEFFE